MKSPAFWFVVLLTVCVVGPYAFGVRPTTHREWTYIAITIAFVAWMLILMAELLAT